MTCTGTSWPKEVGKPPAPIVGRRPIFLRRRTAFADHRTKLTAQLGRIRMLVHGNGVLRSSVEKLILIVGRQCDRAFHVARELAAIDIFPWHRDTPPAGQSKKSTGRAR